MIYLALELVFSWVKLGFSVGMENFDEFLSINVPMEKRELFDTLSGNAN